VLPHPPPWRRAPENIWPKAFGVTWRRLGVRNGVLTEVKISSVTGRLHRRDQAAARGRKPLPRAQLPRKACLHNHHGLPRFCEPPSGGFDRLRVARPLPGDSRHGTRRGRCVAGQHYSTARRDSRRSRRSNGRSVSRRTMGRQLGDRRTVCSGTGHRPNGNNAMSDGRVVERGEAPEHAGSVGRAARISLPGRPEETGLLLLPFCAQKLAVDDQSELGLASR